MDQILEAAAAGDIQVVNSLYNSSSSSISPSSISQIAKEAAKNGHGDILEWCFTKGFQVPSKSTNNEFYHAACSGHSPDVFQVLINHGFDLNAHESEYMGDALVEATRSGDVEFTRFLLDHGQDPNTHRTVAPGELEALTYPIAFEHRSLEILKMLLDHGAEMKDTGCAVAAAEVGNLDALKMLVDRGVDIEEPNMWSDATEDDGFDSEGTPLYRACRLGTAETAKYLLELGANGYARDKAGKSCLAIAKERNHTDIVKLLQENGINE